jgi:dTDP-4-amino-4,6-dideoxygalactose transaminase
MITVTKPYLPEYTDFEVYLKEIWKSNWLTNNGPKVKLLEKKLSTYCGVDHLIYTNNGTIAIQIAIKALERKGEIITTPFSYVATTNSILWEGCTPVFADINESDYNINPSAIESLINVNTIAILATHVYGNPCDVQAIEQIAEKYKLKVIYDGAHAFGTLYKGKPLLSYGDIVTCSFHATKIFHTVEGGAILTNDKELAVKMTHYRQFGHTGDEYFSVGINGKSSEIHAAMGLCIFPMMDKFIERRKMLSRYYDKTIEKLPFSQPSAMEGTIYNYSYYPVVFESEERMLRMKKLLEDNDVATRRYFYPSLNNLPHFKGAACPVSESISSRVLALPLYYGLSVEEVDFICGIIKKGFK